MSDFCINFRVIDDFEYLSKLDKVSLDNELDPEGFFEVRGGDLSYGYFHNNPLMQGEEGDSLIGVWLELFLKATITLFSNSYVAIKDIDSLDMWFELKAINNTVRLIILRINDENSKVPYTSSVITTQKLSESRCYNENEVIIELNDLQDVVTQATKLYLKRLLSINDKYLYTNRYRYLDELRAKLEKLREHPP